MIYLSALGAYWNEYGTCTWCMYKNVIKILQMLCQNETHIKRKVNTVNHFLVADSSASLVAFLIIYFFLSFFFFFFFFKMKMNPKIMNSLAMI